MSDPVAFGPDAQRDSGDVWERLRTRIGMIATPRDRADRTEVERILNERARRFAAYRDRRKATEVAEGRRVLLLLADAERFAVDVDDVLSVVSQPRITTLPGVPRHVRGVFMFSGHLVCTLDLKALAGPHGWTGTATFVACVGRSPMVGLVCSGPGSVQSFEAPHEDTWAGDAGPLLVGTVRGEPATYIPTRYLHTEPSVVVDQRPRTAVTIQRRPE